MFLTTLASLIGLTIAVVPSVEQSCFQRIYTSTHMTRNANQTVKSMTIGLTGKATGLSNSGDYAGVGVLFRDSNHFYQMLLLCGERNGKYWCNVECDGGGASIRWKDRDTILLKTGGFLVDGDCGEGPALREVSDIGVSSTTYRLYRVPAHKCRGLPTGY